MGLKRSDRQTFLELLVRLLSNFVAYLILVGFNPELVLKRIESKRRQNIQEEFDSSILQSLVGPEGVEIRHYIGVHIRNVTAIVLLTEFVEGVAIDVAVFGREIPIGVDTGETVDLGVVLRHLLGEWPITRPDIIGVTEQEVVPDIVDELRDVVFQSLLLFIEIRALHQLDIALDL